MSISDKRFENEFNINNNKLFDMIVDVIKFKEIDNLGMLKIAAKIAKHVENIFIIVQFSNNFKVEDIPDDVIINMLDNVENRL